MAALTQDILDQDAGAYALITVTVRDETGTPIILTSFTIDWALALSPIDMPMMVKSTKAVPGGILILDQGTKPGQFTLELKPEDTVNLNGTFWHEARGKDIANHPGFLLEGKFVVRPASLSESGQ